MDVIPIDQPRVDRLVAGLPSQEIDPADEADPASSAADGFRVFQVERELVHLGQRALPAIRRALDRAIGLRRRALVNALWHFGSATDIPTFVSELESSNADQRVRAASFLGMFETQAAQQGVTAATRDPSAQVRAAAVHALAEHQDWVSPQRRWELLHDPDPRVRLAAVDTLSA